MHINFKLQAANGKFRNNEAYHPCFVEDKIGRGTAPAVVGSSLSVFLQWDRTIFYHPCFDFVEIGRGTAPVVVGSSLSVFLW